MRRGGRPDWLGAMTLSVALVRLLLAVTKGEAWGWGSSGVVGFASCCGGGVLDLGPRRAAGARAARRPAHLRPARDGVDQRRDDARRLLADGVLRVDAGVRAGAFRRSAAGYGFGASAVEAGLFFIPSSLAMIVCGPLAGALGSRHGHALALRIGLGASSSALALLAFAHDGPLARAGLDGRCSASASPLRWPRAGRS